MQCMMQHAKESDFMATKRFLPEQRAILKERMKIHILNGKFTQEERDTICEVTNLSSKQVRMWERNFSRMTYTQRKTFLRQEEVVNPKGFVCKINGTLFNADQAFYERFLMFKDVPDNARIRKLSYLEAITNIESTESTFLLCFKTQVWLSVICKYLAKLGGGSIELVPFSAGNGSTSGAVNALIFMREKVLKAEKSKYTHFKYGKLSKKIASTLKRKLNKQEAEERARTQVPAPF